MLRGSGDDEERKERIDLLRKKEEYGENTTVKLSSEETSRQRVERDREELRHLRCMYTSRISVAFPLDLWRLRLPRRCIRSRKEEKEERRDAKRSKNEEEQHKQFSSRVKGERKKERKKKRLKQEMCHQE